MRSIFIICLSIAAVATAQPPADSPWLYGIHWYGNTDALTIGQKTDVEQMTGDKGVWDLEIALTDSSVIQPWDAVWQTSPLNKTAPGYLTNHAQKIVSGKGHSLVFRFQPNWSRNVPASGDPYTVTNYADDAYNVAYCLRDWCRIFQVGNEVNIVGENMKWGGSAYDSFWQPAPADYAAAYIACRDRIHQVTPNTNPAAEIVLMQPVSPGNKDATTRFADGNEYLYRQIEAVADKSKIDGFAVHGYAEPGAVDFGVSGFWDSVREQLMIIDQLGLGNRPIYMTEWNKHMPDATEAAIGAKFLHRAYTFMRDWNAGSGGEWPGQPNHNVVGAMWFVYPEGFGWDDYSLKHYKMASGGTTETDPWLSFQYAANQNYARGAAGAGPASVPQNALWWQDSFDGATLDESGPLPDWKAEPTNGGLVAMSGTGEVRLSGNNSNVGVGSIRTAGYVYSDLRMEVDVTMTDAHMIATGESNFDVRIREGSQGYSFTMFSSEGTDRSGTVQLRHTGDWTVIKSATIPGGINSGDSFHISVIANGTDLSYKVTRAPAGTVVLDWTGANKVVDAGHKVGWIRLMTYNMKEARVSDVKVGGPNWNYSAAAQDWTLY